ncbi:MAG: VOC family protein [Actinomycetota bacterium]
MMPPQTVAGAGRFAIVADPQNAAFGVIEPDAS